MLNLIAIALFQISSSTVSPKLASLPAAVTVSVAAHGTSGWTGIAAHGTSGWTGIAAHGTSGWTGIV